jgi:transposase-like protein
VWFTAIWWVAAQKGGASAKELQQVLGLKSYETAWAWLHKIRKAMAVPNRTKLSGNVEVEKIYIGKKKNEAHVGVAIQVVDDSKPERVRLFVVPDHLDASFAASAASNIEISSTVTIFSTYGGLLRTQHGFRHTYSRSGDYKTLLPRMQIVVSLFKRWLMGTHHGAVKREHLQDYLDEFTFRFNHRDSANKGLLFYDLLECAMNVKPVTLDELIGKPKKVLP